MDALYIVCLIFRFKQPNICLLVYSIIMASNIYTLLVYSKKQKKPKTNLVEGLHGELPWGLYGGGLVGGSVCADSNYPTVLLSPGDTGCWQLAHVTTRLVTLHSLFYLLV